MRRILRALLISGVATGVVAVVFKTLSRDTPAPRSEPGESGLEELTEDEQRMLLQELEGHV